jgi:16S rRNA (cytosine967-C5)-methyltransferase
MIGIPMTKPKPYDPVRRLAWTLLGEVERSSDFADRIIDRAFSSAPDLRPLDRAFITEMVLGTLRWQGRLDSLIHRQLRSREKKVDPRVLLLLRLGAYQILFMDRVPESAAVDESVRLAKAVFKNEKISGFVNALLRSIARQKDQEDFLSLRDLPAEKIPQALSHPPWMVERWVKEFGLEMARKICWADNQRPPFTIRTNTLKIDRDSLRERLNASGIPSLLTSFSPEGLILRESPLLTQEPLFQEGFYFVQDEASQVVPHLLGPMPGERVLDACAAPGGKSTHLAQLMQNQGEVIALDQKGSKVKLIQENCTRLGITIVRAILADAAKPLSFPPGPAFDRVLLDAPCTGLGVLHRNPEAKWRRKPEDIHRLQKLQALLLDNVSSWLKPGGILVYSTCTMTREENDSAVESFLESHPGFKLEDLRDVVPPTFQPLIDGKGFLRTFPGMITRDEAYRMDGFFAARIRRNPSTKQ